MNTLTLPDLGPLAAFFSWQSLVLALATVALVQVLKNLISATAWAERRFVQVGLVPSLPILVGALIANLSPVHPDLLWKYMEDPSFTSRDRVWILAAYGLVVGLLSSYIWDLIKRFLVKEKKPKRTASSDKHPVVKPPDQPSSP